MNKVYLILWVVASDFAHEFLLHIHRRPQTWPDTQSMFYIGRSAFWRLLPVGAFVISGSTGRFPLVYIRKADVINGT
jgi:hypothetical protein